MQKKYVDSRPREEEHRRSKRAKRSTMRAGRVAGKRTPSVSAAPSVDALRLARADKAGSGIRFSQRHVVGATTEGQYPSSSQRRGAHHHVMTDAHAGRIAVSNAHPVRGEVPPDGIDGGRAAWTCNGCEAVNESRVHEPLLAIATTIARVRTLLATLRRRRSKWAAVTAGKEPARLDSTTQAASACRDAHKLKRRVAATADSVESRLKLAQDLTRVGNDIHDADESTDNAALIRRRDGLRQQAVLMITPDATIQYRVAHSADGSTEWLRKGFHLLDDRVKQVGVCLQQLRSSVQLLSGIEVSPPRTSRCPRGARQKSNALWAHTAVTRVADALSLADELLRGCDAFDTLLSDSVIKPMQQETEAISAAAHQLAQATATLEKQATDIIRAATIPWEKVGSTLDAAHVVDSLTELADKIHDAEVDVRISRLTLTKRQVESDPERMAAAIGEMADAVELHRKVFLAFATLYRSKGRYVMSHFPEYRRRMLKLLPEPLRRSTIMDGPPVYDPTVKLSHFTCVEQPGTASSGGRVKCYTVNPNTDMGLSSGRRVAVKDFTDAHAFIREVAVLKQAELDGIDCVARVLCAFWDSSAEDTTGGAGRFYMVMPWYEGGTVSDWVARANPDLRQRLRVSVELSRDLARLHDHGTTHLDLKPQNIVIDESHGKETRARLIDFGSSRVVKGDAALFAATLTRPISGTIAYMAPELIAAARESEDEERWKACIAELDLRRVDVYSLGKALKAVGLWEEPLLPSAAGDTTQGEIAEVVKRMISDRPEERGTMADAASVFEGLVNRRAGERLFA